MNSLTPNVETMIPICSCGYEVGKLQYQLVALDSFKQFLNEHNINDNNEEVFRILFGKQVALKICCRKGVVFPEFVDLPKEQVSSSQRILPTALPAPLLTGDILEWY